MMVASQEPALRNNLNWTLEETPPLSGRTTLSTSKTLCEQSCTIAHETDKAGDMTGWRAKKWLWRWSWSWCLINEVLSSVTGKKYCVYLFGYLNTIISKPCFYYIGTIISYVIRDNELSIFSCYLNELSHILCDNWKNTKNGFVKIFNM